MRMPDNVASAGVDVHYKFSTVAFVNDRGRTVARWRLDHRDREALAEALACWPKVPTVMEASFGWGWLSDMMIDEHGIDVHLSNCHKVEQMRQARGWVKTNDKDADLQGLLPAEATNWWEVWRAPKSVRDLREWMRHRSDLVKLQTTTKNRIHAIFHRHGVFHDFSDLFGGGGRRFLADLSAGRDKQSGYLSGGATEALQGELRVLDALREELARIAKVLRKKLERTDLARWLISVPGFGLILAHVVMAEVGDLGRFRSSRALASYSLLAPRSFDTGEPTPGRAPVGRHLGQRGNRVLQWAFIEAAHGAVRHGGVWREIFDRVTDGGKRDRGQGYIAVARKLVDVVYAVWRDGRKYQERPAAGSSAHGADGSSKSKSSSKRSARPGTGRPCRPMVVAG